MPICSIIQASQVLKEIAREWRLSIFTLVKKYGKGKEYINCSAYGDKVEKARDFQKGDLIHVFGYFNEREKEGKKYKKFSGEVLQSRIERRKKTEEE